MPGLTVVAVTAFGGSALASATSTKTTANNTSTTTQTQNYKGPGGPAIKDGGKITTDSTVVTAVTKAVQDKYSGATIDRVAKLPDGSYLAFTRQSGNKVIVSLSSSYAITSTKKVSANAPHGPAGPHDQPKAPTSSSSN